MSTKTSTAVFLGLALVFVCMPAIAQSWSAPTTLVSVSGAQLVYGPSVAINAAGEIVASATVNNQVQVQVQQNGIWSTPTVLTTASQPYIFSYAAVAPNGDAVVVWVQGTVSGRQTSLTLQASFYTAGAWSAATTLSSPGAFANGAKVVYDSAGQANVVWAEVDSTRVNCTTFAAIGNSQTGFGKPTPIPGACASYLQLAANQKGEVLALLSYGNGYVVSRNAAGVWGAPVMVAQSGYRPGLQAMALSNQGTAIVAWEYSADVWYSRRAKDGSWSAPATLYAGDASGQVAVGMDAKGNAVTAFSVWNTNRTYGIVYPMKASRLAAGSNSWSKPTLLTGAAVTVGTYSMAVTPAGTFLLGWTDGNSSSPKGNVAVSSMAAGTTSWTKSYLGWGYPDISVAAVPGPAVALWDQYWANPSTSLYSTASVK